MAKTNMSAYIDSETIEVFYNTIELGLRSRYIGAVLLSALAHDAKKRNDEATMEKLLKIAKRLQSKDAVQEAKEQRAIALRRKIFKEPFR